MKKVKLLFVVSVLIILCLIVVGCGQKKEEQQTVKLGYFPNITHSQANVGVANGKFQKALGENIKLETKTFNAGPSEIEALFAGEIDLGYIGPSPAINGYIKSKGESLKIISGANSGGALLIVQKDLASAFKKDGAKSLAGKKIASPQQGNTQDISLRHYLKENNLENKTEIVPIANADQLTMFSQKQLDGAWAPEPWATRLIEESNGVMIIDERDLWPSKKFCTTNLIVSTKFLNEHKDLVKKMLEAHIELTKWINKNPKEAQQLINTEIEKLTTKKLPDKILADSWKNLDATEDPVKNSVMTFADWAYDQGFLDEEKPDLANLYDLTLLNEITGKKY